MKKIFQKCFDNDGIISKHICILDNGYFTFECMLPEGIYILLLYSNNHKLIEANIWKMY